MISEVDLRDWDKVDFKKLNTALENMDDYARMANINPYGPYIYLKHSLALLEKIKNKQLRKIPKLERK